MATKQWMCLIRIEIEQFGVEAETKQEFIQINISPKQLDVNPRQV